MNGLDREFCWSKLKSNHSDNVLQLGRNRQQSQNVPSFLKNEKGLTCFWMGDLSDRTSGQKCLHGLFRLAQSIKQEMRRNKRPKRQTWQYFISADSVWNKNPSATTSTTTTTILQSVRFMKLVYEHEKWRSGPFETTHIIGCQETRENLARPSFTTKETSAKRRRKNTQTRIERCAAWMVSHTSL